MEEWINDGAYICTNCELTFKVYAKDEEPTVWFCPTCGHRGLEAKEEDEKE